MMTTHTQKSHRPLRIFLSYSSKDAHAGLQLRRFLSHQTNSDVFARDSLSAGKNWQATLKDNVVGCDVFIVLFSPNTSEDPWVLQELGAAWALEKPKLVVLTDPALNVFLTDIEAEDQVVTLGEIEDVEVLHRVLAHYRHESEEALLLAS